jgi:hypothetical protein
MHHRLWIAASLLTLITTQALANSPLEVVYQKNCNPDATRVSGERAQRALMQGDTESIQREMHVLQDCRRLQEQLGASAHAQ